VGETPYEQRFAEAFAAYNDVPYCVACDHGSSALLLALEALDLGPGDEVIVPVLTWVATATAVLNVNAIPVFVDIDVETGCINPSAVEKAITPQTKAIIAVHLHCTMADVDALTAIASRHGVYLVEDCAQSHGSTWLGKRAGTFGILGAFSMQQSKVLTAGEGGAVIARDPKLYERLQLLRADARMYSPTVPALGDMYLVPAGEVMGTNYCLSELQAAVLLEGLGRLDTELELRERRAVLLDAKLGTIHGVTPLRLPPQLTRRTVYEYGVRISPRHFGGHSSADVAQELTRKLGFPLYPTDRPLHVSPLYRPLTKKRYRLSDEHVRRLAVDTSQFPAADQFWREFVAFHHGALLTEDERIVDRIVAAYEEVQANLSAA
jgi:L-glutamine:2-deoxy-scyllo-inosose/3-amino-2,3-dideoxy-scyllo-inosose aminotransferase